MRVRASCWLGVLVPVMCWTFLLDDPHLAFERSKRSERTPADLLKHPARQRSERHP